MSLIEKTFASAGNRTRVAWMATMHSTTKPQMRDIHFSPLSTQFRRNHRFWAVLRIPRPLHTHQSKLLPHTHLIHPKNWKFKHYAGSKRSLSSPFHGYLGTYALGAMESTHPTLSGSIEHVKNTWKDPGSAIRVSLMVVKVGTSSKQMLLRFLWMCRRHQLSLEAQFSLHSDVRVRWEKKGTTLSRTFIAIRDLVSRNE